MWARKEECTDVKCLHIQGCPRHTFAQLLAKSLYPLLSLSVYLHCPPSLSFPTIPAPLRKDEEQKDFEEPEPGAEGPVLPLQESPRVESGSGMRQIRREAELMCCERTPPCL
ncbi:hypothetical protein R3I93_004344 [Phoxinus phoxinus]|uniref:Uncharacterized protein n=1 Tax=Phoxinus phoxinus TaxID=58324 RepID=A0AAN9DIL4_9TELE